MGVTSVLFREDCLSREDLVPDLYFPWPEVGSIQLVVFAKLGEDLSGFGCISPGVVSFSEKQRKDRWSEAGFPWEDTLNVPVQRAT